MQMDFIRRAFVKHELCKTVKHLQLIIIMILLQRNIYVLLVRKNNVTDRSLKINI